MPLLSVLVASLAPFFSCLGQALAYPRIFSTTEMLLPVVRRLLGDIQDLLSQGCVLGGYQLVQGRSLQTVWGREVRGDGQVRRTAMGHAAFCSVAILLSDE